MTLYRIVRPVVVGLCSLLWRMRVEGADRVPATGGCILAPSHRSMMDIPFLGTVTRRRIRFMGKRQVFDLPLLGRVFRALGSFPVARDGDDRVALRAALRILDEQDPLAVFPEGTRQHGSRIAPLQRGAAYLALRAGVPIVPVGIAGSEEIFRAPRRGGGRRRLPGFGRVAVVVGDPIVPVAREGGTVPRARVDELTARLHTALQDVQDRAEALR